MSSNYIKRYLLEFPNTATNEAQNWGAIVQMIDDYPNGHIYSIINDKEKMLICRMSELDFAQFTGELSLKFKLEMTNQEIDVQKEIALRSVKP